MYAQNVYVLSKTDDLAFWDRTNELICPISTCIIDFPSNVYGSVLLTRTRCECHGRLSRVSTSASKVEPVKVATLSDFAPAHLLVRRAKPTGDVRRTPHFPWPFTAMSTAVEDSKDATSTTFEWKPGTYLPNPEARMLNALESAEYENVLERIVDTDKVECVRPCVPRCPRPCYLQDRVAAPVRYYQIQDLKSQFLEISCVPRSHCPTEHGRIP
jgi:hypothetical protein